MYTDWTVLSRSAFASVILFWTENQVEVLSTSFDDVSRKKEVASSSKKLWQHC